MTQWIVGLGITTFILGGGGSLLRMSNLGRQTYFLRDSSRIDWEIQCGGILASVEEESNSWVKGDLWLSAWEVFYSHLGISIQTWTPGLEMLVSRSWSGAGVSEFFTSLGRLWQSSEWLGFGTFIPVAWVQPPVRELRSQKAVQSGQKKKFFSSSPGDQVWGQAVIRDNVIMTTYTINWTSEMHCPISEPPLRAAYIIPIL